MRNSISHPKNDFEGIRSHNPTKLLCLSPQHNTYSGNHSTVRQFLTGETQSPRDVLAQNVQPLPWDDSEVGLREL